MILEELVLHLIIVCIDLIDVILKVFYLFLVVCLYLLNRMNEFHLLGKFILHVRHLVIERLNFVTVFGIEIALGQVQPIIYTHPDLRIVQIESCAYHVSLRNNILKGSYCNYSCLDTARSPGRERVIFHVYVTGGWARPTHGQVFQVNYCLFLIN